MLNPNITSPQKPQDPQRARSLGQCEENEDGLSSGSNETNGADVPTQANHRCAEEDDMARDAEGR